MNVQGTNVGVNGSAWFEFPGVTFGKVKEPFEEVSCERLKDKNHGSQVLRQALVGSGRERR